jgi:ribose 5-phosphate isomerase RpiB
MNVVGGNHDATPAGGVLLWSGRIVTAEGLQQFLNGERQLIVSSRTVITPSALDHLKSKGVKVVREDQNSEPQAKEERVTKSFWGYMTERPDPVVSNVVQALKRDGLDLREILMTPRETSATRTNQEYESLACGLARQAADIVAGGECRRVVVFCLDPGLTCCIANKVKGIRAVAMGSANQAQRSVKGLGANVLALELGKATFFEMRQILKSACSGSTSCSQVVAEVIQELEGPCQCQHSGPAAGQKPGLKEECKCGGNHAHR